MCAFICYVKDLIAALLICLRALNPSSTAVRKGKTRKTKIRLPLSPTLRILISSAGHRFLPKHTNNTQWYLGF